MNKLWRPQSKISLEEFVTKRLVAVIIKNLYGDKKVKIEKIFIIIKDVNITKICTIFLDRPIWHSSKHAGHNGRRTLAVGKKLFFAASLNKNT